MQSAKDSFKKFLMRFITPPGYEDHHNYKVRNRSFVPAKSLYKTLLIGGHSSTGNFSTVVFSNAVRITEDTTS